VEPKGQNCTTAQASSRMPARRRSRRLT
jgi:hypothetical protein